ARKFVSGEMRSKYNNYRYGHYEVRYHSPVANPDPTKGGYLSTMFIFRTPKWKTWNEIDIELEPGGGSSVHQVAGNIVDFVNTGMGVPGYPAGNASPFSIAQAAPFTHTETHTYAFDWTPMKVTWYVDGKEIHSFAGTNNVKIPNLSAKIMMNL